MTGRESIEHSRNSEVEKFLTAREVVNYFTEMMMLAFIFSEWILNIQRLSACISATGTSTTTHGSKKQ